MAGSMRLLEKNLIQRVLRPLPKTVHSQSMTFGSMSQNGTPDRYFDGTKRDLWVEFKQLKTTPRDGIAVGAYTEQQLRWMERRWRVGKNVVGVVGLVGGKAVMQMNPHEWRNGSPVDAAVDVKEVSKWIEDFCGS